MLGIGLYEVIIIFILAVVILKPKDFIKIVVFCSTIIKKIKELFEKVKEEVDDLEVIEKFDDYTIIEKKERDSK